MRNSIPLIRSTPRLWLPTCCGVLLAIATGCHSWHSPEATAQDDPVDVPIPDVTVTTIQERTWEKTVHVHGMLAPDETAVVGAKVAGRIGKVLINVGDRVTAGQPIAQLDDLQLQLEVRQAETLLAQACAAIGLTPDESTDDLVPENSPVVRQEKALLDQSQLTLERVQSLAQRNAATQEQVDEAEAAQKVAAARHAAALNSLAEKIALIAVRRADLDVAKNALAESTIFSPFDGIVQEKSTAAGAYVSTGDPVATVLRCDKLRFVGSVPEKQSHSIALHQEVRLQLRHEDEPRIISINRFRPLIDPMSRALIFEADVPNEGCEIQPGLFAEAEIVIDPEAKALVVPKSAIFEFAGIEKVWRVVDGEAQETVVDVLARRNDEVAIQAGVKVGNVVITDATQGRSGKVNIVSSPES